MDESNYDFRNGVSIDKTKAQKIIKKITYDELLNQRLKQFSDGDMVAKHIKTIKEILNAYKED